MEKGEQGMALTQTETDTADEITYWDAEVNILHV